MEAGGIFKGVKGFDGAAYTQHFPLNKNTDHGRMPGDQFADRYFRIDSHGKGL